MSRKDYRALAAALHGAKPVAMPYRDEDAWKVAYRAWENSVAAVTYVLAADNPRFRSDLFHLACCDGAA